MNKACFDPGDWQPETDGAWGGSDPEDWQTEETPDPGDWRPEDDDQGDE
jgi:hypothetical protein